MYWLIDLVHELITQILFDAHTYSFKLNKIKLNWFF